MIPSDPILLSLSGCSIAPFARPSQHSPIKRAGERGRVTRVSKFKLKPNFPVRQERNLEQVRLGFVVIDPGPHLSHDGAQIGVTTANLNNMHALLPLNGPKFVKRAVIWPVGRRLHKSLMPSATIWYLRRRSGVPPSGG